MIDKKIEKAFNDQINAELHSAYLYLSMVAYFESEGLKGFANWMRVQVQEEQEHGMKFFDFICERGGRVKLQPIEGPEVKWDAPKAAFDAAYKHECYISDRINKLVDLAIAEKDHAANAFLQWFVTEQVEEEDNASTIAGEMALIGDDRRALLMIDRELGQRTYTPPAAEGEE